MTRSLPFLRLAALATLGLTCSACSFLFTKKPPSEPEKLPIGFPVKCTSSVAAPVIDTIIGGFEVVRTGLAISADDSTYQNAQINREMDIGFGVTLAALYISSAVYGFTITGNCRDLKTRLGGNMPQRPQEDPNAPGAANDGEDSTEARPPADARSSPPQEGAPLPSAY